MPDLALALTPRTAGLVAYLVFVGMLTLRARALSAGSSFAGRQGISDRVRTLLLQGKRAHAKDAGAAEAASDAAAQMSPMGTPMPKSGMHKSLQRGIEQRCFVIGDVHGCYDELQLLLRKCEYVRGRDRVVLTGDLVNKGPKSLEVVRLAMEEGFVGVRGNHDDIVVAARLRLGRYSGVPVLPAEHQWVDKLTTEETQWLADLPYTLSLPEYDALVVHAGLVPGVPLEHQDPGHMYTMRSLVRRNDSTASLHYQSDHEASSAPPTTASAVTNGEEPRAPWAQVYEGPPLIIFGHDAKRGLQQEKWALGLDTGCLYGRSLTACIFPGKELISVEALKTYIVPGSDRKH